MEVTVENIEFYLLILVRISAFFFVAPIFSLKSVPFKVRAAISFFLTIIVAPIIGTSTVEYSSLIGLAGLVVKEFLVGILIGFFSDICIRIIGFAGQLMDTEIGFAMASVFDPVSNSQVTITGNLFTYLVMLTLLATNMHQYIIKAIVSSFRIIPITKAYFSPNLYKLMVNFMSDFFILGFRIVLPIFSAILIVNVVLAILAKVSPQMNMFVVGFQLKILVGLLTFLVVVTLIPSISQFVFGEMKTMIDAIMKGLAG